MKQVYGEDMEITREQFQELMGLQDGDDGMEMADEYYYETQSWWEVAKGMIASMNLLLLEES